MRYARTDLWPLVAILALSLGACATAEPPLTEALPIAEDPQVGVLQPQLSALREENGTLKPEPAVLEAGPSVPREPAESAQEDALLPPPAQPGACHARVFVPPTFRTVAEQVLQSEASESVEVIPARYAMVDETILIREESERIEVIPATFKTVEERILVREAYEKIEMVPASYETVTERVVVKPPYTAWQGKRGPFACIEETISGFMCLAEVPAEYQTVTRQVMVSPATTRKVTVPAEYRTVTRSVVDQPAQTRIVKEPAQYSTVQVRRLLEPAKEKRLVIPARFQKVAKTQKVREGRMEWRPVLCEADITPDLVSRIQSALLARGYLPGVVDGILGPRTLAAVTSFQQDNNTSSGALTIETVRALGVQ
ncbi:peptidoglycan-binding protein [Pelagibius sp.]|uniref:peptidoglycan-binding domain-containing protein n=1 Tax=Pelagibius sp. TaxID=1931238 RepID=UPI00262870B1|nr:peptidoglycan-binding domain-containing protein [Pelagibius sp.]